MAIKLIKTIKESELEVKKNFYKYMFYRITNSRFTKESGQGNTGIAFVTLSQTMIFIDILILIINLLFENPLRAKIFNIGRIPIVIGYFLLTYYNYKKYYNTNEILSKQWNNEDRVTRNRNLIFIVLAILLPILLPILYSFKW